MALAKLAVFRPKRIVPIDFAQIQVDPEKLTLNSEGNKLICDNVELTLRESDGEYHIICGVVTCNSAKKHLLYQDDKLVRIELVVYPGFYFKYVGKGFTEHTIMHLGVEYYPNGTDMYKADAGICSIKHYSSGAHRYKFTTGNITYCYNDPTCMAVVRKYKRKVIQNGLGELTYKYYND